ncbi:hypothetical protein ABT279_00165 [Amycolatopsis sp. NPDC000673]|uniref:hypothetical protein n=1 Tax=unclassified Amycolatopsis TaxID=2618356 RepID=UPI0033181D87
MTPAAVISAALAATHPAVPPSSAPKATRAANDARPTRALIVRSLGILDGVPAAEILAVSRKKAVRCLAGWGPRPRTRPGGG